LLSLNSKCFASSGFPPFGFLWEGWAIIFLLHPALGDTGVMFIWHRSELWFCCLRTQRIKIDRNICLFWAVCYVWWWRGRAK
jgi:hypothetical protein